MTADVSSTDQVRADHHTGERRLVSRSPDLTELLPDLIEELRQRQAEHDRSGDTSELMVTLPAAQLVGLYQRLASQPLIEQAKGILMGAYRIDADRAYHVLVRFSQDANVKVRMVARYLTQHQVATELAPAALLERLRQVTERVD